MAKLIEASGLLEQVVRIQASEQAPEKKVGQIIMAITNAPVVDAVQAQRWIPVTERLPDRKYFCLTTRKGDVYVEFWNGVIFSERNRCAQPTHWMPLPEAPKEG